MTAAESITAALAVLALFVSIAAFVYARRGTIAAERSAVAAEASARTAAATLTENRRSADAAVAAAAAAERSADLADEALHPMPTVDLRIEKGRGNAEWILRNDGALTARKVQAVDELQGMFRLPDGTEDVPGNGGGLAFAMMSSSGGKIPPHLHFVWEGQDEPVAVRVPLGGG